MSAENHRHRSTPESTNRHKRVPWHHVTTAIYNEIMIDQHRQLYVARGHQQSNEFYLKLYTRLRRTVTSTAERYGRSTYTNDNSYDSVVPLVARSDHSTKSLLTELIV